jgi:TonB family protein
MFNLRLSVLLLATCSCAAIAQTPDASQRIAQLANDTSLLRDGMRPWHLSMTFDLYTLDGKKKESGTIEEWWVSPTQRRLVIASPSFNQTIPNTTGEVVETANREAFIIHSLLDQVTKPIPPFSGKEALSVSEERKSFGKVKLSCVNVSRKLPANGGKIVSLPGPVFCLNPDSDILRTLFDDDQGKAIVRNRLGKFRDTYVAQDITINYYGKIAIEGKVVTLETYDPQANPVDLITVDRSPAELPGIVVAGNIIKKVQPKYPELAKQRQISGTVVVIGIISREGKMRSLDIASTASPMLDQAALDAVKQWEYQPFLRNGQPTEVTTTITVHFNLSQSQFVL